jgi:RHS repeat-associated protein
VTLYGLATPAWPSYPSFSGINGPSEQVLWASPPGQLVGLVSNGTTGQDLATILSYMRPKADGWWFGITGNEGGGGLVHFDLNNVYVTYFYVQQPPPTQVTAPSGVVSTATPTLTAAVKDSTDNPVYYDFRIATSPGGTGTVADSGWLSNQTSWTVPVGSLQDGVTYYATVEDAVSDQWDTCTCDGYVPAAAPLVTTAFTVKERLGGGGPSPTDTVGSPPQGTSTPSQGAPTPGVATASETVDMVTGNLAVKLGTPVMRTLSGPAGVTLTYNSSSSSTATGVGNYGLTGQYYTDDYSTDHSHSFDSPVVGQRTEAVSQAWGSNSPVSGLNPWQPFLVRWKGWISLPAGTWELGGLATGGLRIYLNGSSTLSYDDWAGTASTSSPSFGTTTVSGGAQYQVEVDDWDTSQTGNTTVQLWARNTAIADTKTQPNFYQVPSNWLTPAATGVPPGWSLLASPAVVAWTHADDQGNQVVLSGAGGDTVAFTRLSDGSYQSPPADADYLGVDGNGHLQLATSTNQLYTFNADGSLASMTTIADDLHPAALQYTYTGSPALLTAITDPVSGRSITLSYGGSSGCPASPPAGAFAAPAGMLCQISYWDGTSTAFWYTGSAQIAQVTSPGNQVTQFAYDASNRLADIRDGLAAEYLAAGGQAGTPVSCGSGTTGLAVAPVDTQICFDASGRVATITQPAPTPGASRPTRTYSYGSGLTSMSIDGFSPSSGYAEKVTYDGQDRITGQYDPAGHATTTVWATAASTAGYCGPACGADEPIVTVSPAGGQTSTVYDGDGNISDTYGPAPIACFSGGWPSSVTPPAGVPGYLPVANPQGTPGCGVAVPHARHGYDEQLTGLAETFWADGQSAGPAALHGTSTSAPQPSSFCGTSATLCAQWAPGSPPVSSDASGHWSLRLTGTVNLPVTGSYGFALTASQPASVSIDGYQILDDSPSTDPGFAAGQQNTVQVGADSGPAFAAGLHQIEVSFQGSATQLNDFQIIYSYYNAATGNYPSQLIPDTVLDPNYGLQTSTTDPDGIRTTTTYSNSAIGPEYGLPTSVTVGAGSSTPLTTTTAYETPGAGSYLRATSKTLPAGNTTSYSYYTGTADPLSNTCGVTSGTPQGGQLELLTGPAPTSGAPAREQQFIYDAAGRQAGVRTGPSNAISSQPWQCTTYDALGRISSQTWPAFNSAPARAVTHTYSVGGNPLVTSESDGSGTITSTVDLLGRVTGYTDAKGQTTTTSYDQAGRVSSSASPAGTITNGYDNFNSGALTSVTISSRLNSTLNNFTLASATYDSAGRLSTVYYSDGTAAAIGYDAYGNENSLVFTKNSGGALVAGDKATYSAARRIYSEQEDLNGTLANPNPAGSSSTDYTYDGAGRLITAYLPGGTLASYSYAQNPSGDNCTSPSAGANTNRTRVTITPGAGSATTTDYCYNNADQVTSTIANGTSTTTFAYDGHGNQTGDGGTTLTWDASDRVTSIATGGSTTSLTYDALDRVIARQAGGTTTGYWYSGYTDTPAGTLNRAGSPTNAFIGLPGGVTVTIQATGNTWSYPDLHGNYTVATDDVGTPQGSPATYDPWGQPTSGSQALGNVGAGSDLGGYGADGKITDNASGIITVGARAYNPAEGRFLSVDPQQGGCANPYTYAFGDPLNHPDLTGQGCGSKGPSVWDIVLGAIGLAVGVVALVTGIGALVETSALIGATAEAADGLNTAVAALSLASTAAGLVSTVLDFRDCLKGDGAACVATGAGLAGVVLGAYGSVLGFQAAIADSGSWEIQTEIDGKTAFLMGTGAFAYVTGEGATVIDLGRITVSPCSQ